jgi:predicted amidophosphoribosyltransferase
MCRDIRDARLWAWLTAPRVCSSCGERQASNPEACEQCHDDREAMYW